MKKASSLTLNLHSVQQYCYHNHSYNPWSNEVNDTRKNPLFDDIRICLGGAIQLTAASAGMLRANTPQARERIDQASYKAILALWELGDAIIDSTVHDPGLEKHPMLCYLKDASEYPKNAIFDAFVAHLKENGYHSHMAAVAAWREASKKYKSEL